MNITVAVKINQKKKHVKSSANTSTAKVSKEEMMQEHVQSILRLDNYVRNYTSSTAKKSFTRHSSDLKQQQKQKKNLKRNPEGISNSRSSSSSFAQKTHEKTFDKEKEKRRREQGYFGDVARALKKAKKSKKKQKKQKSL
mmetsp:Transcript_15191/g.27544  ORF Transcript_15191/g.27544 Transcript_15191/m.27544 type:complete len:140 (-) Transcript_15191:18-437(-)